MNYKFFFYFSLLASSIFSQGKTLVISKGDCDFLPILEELKIPYRRSPSLFSLTDLKGFSALIICSLDYPQPNLLGEEDIEKIERFLQEGGRVFMEYSLPLSEKEIFGLWLERTPRRMLYERLLVKGEHYVTHPLKENTLLEEHNSAYLFPSKIHGEPILWYGKFLGTYELFERNPWVEATLDLGEVEEISSFRARYGASIADYCPDLVEIYISRDGKDFQFLQRKKEPGFLLEVPIEKKARFIKQRLLKYRISPTTDWLFLGEMEAVDEGGNNLALHKVYTLSPPPNPSYPDDGRKLTDGIIEGHYSDGLSCGWTTSEPPPPPQPALLEIKRGKGKLLFSLLKISDYKNRFFRPSEKWEVLLRRIVLYLLPEGERKEVEEKYIPLKAWTEPRDFVPLGEAFKLIVETRKDAGVRAVVASREIELEKKGNGRWEGEVELGRGEHKITVEASFKDDRIKREVEIEVADRREIYRRALDRNIRWFLRSGVMPLPNGSKGVYNQKCIAWFDGGPEEWLPSPYRVDCNAMSAVAFHLYGKLRGEEKYKEIAKNIVDYMLPHQFSDKGKSSFGGWPWLYENIDTIYFWDDNTRTPLALLYLYKETGEERYLRSAIRTLELERGVAQADGVIARHAISPGELDNIGRSAYRQFQQGLAVDFDLLRWFYAYAVTGDEEYLRLGKTALGCWRHRATVRGLPIAYFYTQDDSTKAMIVKFWHSYLEDPDVKKWGAPRVGAADFALAFVGDCSITTSPQDPLTDQLYQTSFLALHAWWSYTATGDEACLEAFHKIADYLCRIQMRSKDERIDGAWVRGWDLERWECYGAPYDPAYGPYSAYTGWMNSIIDIALALYLLGENPFPLPKEKLPIVAEERKSNPPDRIKEENIALHKPYTLTPSPEGKYADSPSGKLTDGVVDGYYEDLLSVGWHIGKGKEISVEMTLDLGRECYLGMVAQRYGGGMDSYIPDKVEVFFSKDGKEWSKAGEGKPKMAGFWYLSLPPTPARYIKFRSTKKCTSPTTDFLFLGETLTYEAR